MSYTDISKSSTGFRFRCWIDAFCALLLGIACERFRLFCCSNSSCCCWIWLRTVPKTAYSQRSLAGWADLIYRRRCNWSSDLHAWWPQYHLGIPETQYTSPWTSDFLLYFPTDNAFIITNGQAVRNSAGFSPCKISSNSSAVSVTIRCRFLGLKAVFANLRLNCSIKQGNHSIYLHLQSNRYLQDAFP